MLYACAARLQMQHCLAGLEWTHINHDPGMGQGDVRPVRDFPETRHIDKVEGEEDGFR